MTTEDQQIKDAFLNARVNGCELGQEKPEHIETLISDLYLYKGRVVKIYKKDSETFNKEFHDLSDSTIRRKFFRDDFFWNHYFNPDVYEKVISVTLSDDAVILSDNIDDTDDLAILMKRIDANDNFTRMLLEDQASTEVVREVGYQMTKKIAKFPGAIESTRNYWEIMMDRLDDMEIWALMSKDTYIPETEVREITDRMRSYLRENYKDEYEKMDETLFVTGLDNHSDNVFAAGMKVSFIDGYPPKPDWIPVMPEINILRLSGDVAALHSTELADSLLQGYYDYYNAEPFAQEYIRMYQVYAALIKGPYVHIISSDRGDEAEMYKDFIGKYKSSF